MARRQSQRRHSQVRREPNGRVRRVAAPRPHSGRHEGSTHPARSVREEMSWGFEGFAARWWRAPEESAMEPEVQAEAPVEEPRRE